MIYLLLSLAFAQPLPLPSEANNYRTCHMMFSSYEREVAERRKESDLEMIKCRKAQLKLPTEQQKFVSCYSIAPYGIAAEVENLFMRKCMKVLTDMNIPKILHGPWNKDDLYPYGI